MKFSPAAVIVLLIAVVGLIVFCNYYFTPPPPIVLTTETINEQVADESTLDDSKAVTIVAMYRYMGVTMTLKTGGKGFISGGSFSRGSSFNWVEKGKIIEMTNWTYPKADGGKALCKKNDGDIDISWHENGIRCHDTYYEVKVQ